MQFHDAATGSPEGLKIILHSGFNVENWPELKDFYRAKIADGIHDIDLDLREIQFFCSMMLGYIIEMNITLARNRGSLRLIVAENSKLRELLFTAKIDRIVPIKIQHIEVGV